MLQVCVLQMQYNSLPSGNCRWSLGEPHYFVPCSRISRYGTGRRWWNRHGLVNTGREGHCARSPCRAAARSHRSAQTQFVAVFSDLYVGIECVHWVPRRSSLASAMRQILSLQTLPSIAWPLPRASIPVRSEVIICPYR